MAAIPVDYYERLRVSRTASRAQIRAAYLQLIAVHHPDRNPSPDAATVTSELNEAYSVLEDAEKRRAYDDTFRVAAAARPEAPGRDYGPSPWRPDISQARETAAGPRKRSATTFVVAIVAPLFFSACAVWLALKPAAEVLAESPQAARSAAIAPAAADAPQPQREIQAAGVSVPEVARLAAIVEVRSTFVGTHSEGETIVRDHVIDRSRIDASEIDQIADAIQRHIGEADRSDLRLVAAYFNARVLALSIRIINALRAGQPIRDHASGVERLIRSESVTGWLGSSAYARPAADLLKELGGIIETYRGGPPLVSLEQELARRKRELSDERAKLEFLRDANTYQYNALVGGHNRRIRAAAALLRKYRGRANGMARLELAFNRCLDPRVLFTRPTGVDISRATSGFDDFGDPASP